MSVEELAPLYGWRVWWLFTSKKWVCKPPDSFWKDRTLVYCLTQESEFFTNQHEAFERAKSYARKHRTLATLYSKNLKEVKRVDYRLNEEGKETRCRDSNYLTSGRYLSQTQALHLRK